MTLHWWMHWFWVTLLLGLLGCIGAAPQYIATELDPASHAERRGRAMYFTKTPPVQTVSPTPPLTSTEPLSPSSIPPTSHEEQPTTEPTTKSPLNTSHDDSQHNSTAVPSTSNNETVNPEVIPQANVTTSSSRLQDGHNDSTAAAKKRNNLTRISDSPEVTDDKAAEGAAESRIVTEKPLSLETAYLQTRLPPNVESRRIVESEAKDGMDTGAIAGISFAALALVALGGSTGFVLYRRRYLNKPQTLNDKCSNPDSSGYLDDSTVRENSEEMYSLDNDSFLNSLEAMTIQNYWTDTVKHTKL